MAKTAVLLPRQEMQAILEHLIEGYKMLTPMCIEHIQTQNVCARARELEEQGCELIVARGLQAALIKQTARVPVVSVVITTQELGILTRQLVRDTGLLHPKIGLIGFENMLSDISRFDDLFDVELVRYLIPEQTTSDTAQMLLELTDRAVREGCQAIIGGDLACARAAEHALPHCFLSSGLESLRIAFATAERVAYAIDLEKRNSAEMNTIFWPSAPTASSTCSRRTRWSAGSGSWWTSPPAACRSTSASARSTRRSAAVWPGWR